MEDTSKSSSSEESEQNYDHTGPGRSYECVFCKRGFTTAQALGGHMNIHRKDRPKPRPSSVINPSAASISRSSADHHHQSYLPIQTYSTQHYPTPHPDPQVSSNYQTSFPAHAWNNLRQPHVHTQHSDDHDQFSVQNPLRLNRPFEEDWQRSRSMQVNPSSRHVDHDDHRERTEDGSDEDDQLDLELRLGHYP